MSSNNFALGQFISGSVSGVSSVVLSGSYGDPGVTNDVSGTFQSLPLGKYQSTDPTLVNGQFVPLQVSSRGQLKVLQSGSYGEYVRSENEVSGVLNVLPVRQYNSASITVADQQFIIGQADSFGNEKVAESFAPGYEDNTNGIATTVTKPLAVSTYTLTYTGSNGNMESGVIKASAGNLYLFHTLQLSSISGNLFLQFFNRTTVPTAQLAIAPGHSYLISTASAQCERNVGKDNFGDNGENFATGIAWGLSSQLDKFKAVAASGSVSFIAKFGYK